jgi:hypothetical protein
MQPYISNSRLKRILFVALTNFLGFLINTRLISASGEITQPTTTGDSATLSPTAQNNAGTLSVTPTTFLQNGSNNYANVNPNTNALSYPFCSGTCGFAIVRTTSSNYINSKGNQIEGIIGLIYSFDSPDQTNAENNKQLVDIQRQRSENQIASDYIKAISDACQIKDAIRAELNAKALARVWAVDYKSLLSPNCQ